MSMPAGTYVICDLCYVMTNEEWEDFCEITTDGYKCLSGEFQMPDGRKFATYKTAYGDGEYYDQLGKRYCVDAGLIGCIKVEDIRANKYDDIERLGTIHRFGFEFATGCTNGIIRFGHVEIDTDPTDYEPDYEDEYNG